MEDGKNCVNTKSRRATTDRKLETHIYHVLHGETHETHSSENITTHLRGSGRTFTYNDVMHSKVSMQDTMLKLKHHIIEDPGTSTKAILGLDLKKAFDSVAHVTVRERVKDLGL